MKTESFLKQIEAQIRSGNSGLWIVTHESEEVLRSFLSLSVMDSPINLFSWDAADGVSNLKDPTQGMGGGKDPVAVMNVFRERGMLKDVDDDEFEGTREIDILLLENFHLTLDHPIVKQTLINGVQSGKPKLMFYIVISPKTELPLELQHLFTLVDFLPPDREEVGKIAKSINAPLLDHPAVIDSVMGLTRREVEQSFSMGCIKDSMRTSTDRLREVTEDLWDNKEQILRQKNFLKLLRSKKGFSSLGGLSGVKSFLTKLLDPLDDSGLAPKGVLLLGPPGTGKSMLAKTLGWETQRAVIQLDIGACYQKHVGESEANIRDALNTISSMGKVILFLDELEKALSGVGGEGDSGVSSRVFGTLLTWLSDRGEDAENEVFFIATSNDISRLPPELSRAGRFDRIFFLDLPNEEEREEIWKFYCNKFSIPFEHHFPVKEANWTGAEIEQACYLSRKLKTPLLEISKEIVPVSESYGEKIQMLRENSNNKYICARTGKRYIMETTSSNKGLTGKVSLSTPRRKLLGGKETEE